MSTDTGIKTINWSCAVHAVCVGVLTSAASSIFCRKFFEPFTGIHPTVAAAQARNDPAELVEMAQKGVVYNADPDYITPKVKDLEIVFIAFDILYHNDRSVINLSLEVRRWNSCWANKQSVICSSFTALPSLRTWTICMWVVDESFEFISVMTPHSKYLQVEYETVERSIIQGKAMFLLPDSPARSTTHLLDRCEPCSMCCDLPRSVKHFLHRQCETWTTVA